MRNTIYWFLILFLCMAAVEGATAEEWYVSNAAGMTLEPAPTRLAALRNKYCLSSARIPFQDLLPYLQTYYKPSYRIELNTLYENGKPSKQQWIFRDSRGITRLVASLNTVSEPADTQEELPAANPTGFIEIYGEDAFITEEHEFSSDGSEKIFNYFYNKQFLVRVETRLKMIKAVDAEEADALPEPVISWISTDHYRYSRSNSLRAIERTYHTAVNALSEEEAASKHDVTQLQFPRLGLNMGANTRAANHGTAYSSDFLQDVLISPGDKVVYTTNERGRVLSEVRQDEAGETQGEIRNTWTGERLESVDWKSGTDERRIEYEYDNEGNRIVERNYNKGVLERTIRKDANGQEIEELYMNGEVILRAIWEDGRKVSEERVRPQR